jgi:hypothetical protein
MSVWLENMLDTGPLSSSAELFEGVRVPKISAGVNAEEIETIPGEKAMPQHNVKTKITTNHSNLFFIFILLDKDYSTDYIMEF